MNAQHTMQENSYLHSNTHMQSFPHVNQKCIHQKQTKPVLQASPCIQNGRKLSGS